MVSASQAQPQSIRFGVGAWAAWLPGRDAMVTNGTLSADTPIPASLRRRVTPIGRKALEAAWAILAGRSDSPRIVLSSRHGEYVRTFGLQVSLAESGELSPAEFSLSVHHGLAGLLSIATGNKSAHTALAGGAESFGYGCLEAATSLAQSPDPVLLIHFDAPLPESYAAISDGAEDSVALALLLAPQGEKFSVEFSPSLQPGKDSLALKFAELLATSAQDITASGDRMNWRWRRVE